MTPSKEIWGSRLGLVLAMAGNAVGLGNFLRFPISAIQNGGGAFIIPYLVSFVLLGIPLMMIEWSTGRFGGSFNCNSTPYILQSLNKRRIWKYIGGVGIFSNLVVASYYCYIESWTLSYIYHSIIGTFRGMSEMQVSNFFDIFLDVRACSTEIPYEPFISFIICLTLNIFILCRGLKNGIEIIAKICMPLLVIFGLFLAIKSFTLKAGVDGAKYDGIVGFNFLWTPNMDSLTNPKVWLAAAGQIFFTLSLGMGCIQCYASYLKKNDDITLNALTTGFTNEFCEIIIGSAVIIPISIGYFGIDKVLELTNLGGFGLGFRSLPYLFQNWGNVLGTIAGIAFFGLLFLSSITSSLALGSPIVAFLKDGFFWGRKKASITFGIIILLLGLPIIFFFQQGILDEYDYWGGTIALVFFAMIESILFAWIIGVDKGWKMIHQGADLQLPIAFKYIIKFITPTFLIIIFLSSLIKPKNDDWSQLSLQGWELDATSIIAELNYKTDQQNTRWFADTFYAEHDGVVDSIFHSEDDSFIMISGKLYSYDSDDTPVVSAGDTIHTGDAIYTGFVTNRTFYIDMTRILLLILLISTNIMVVKGYRNRKKKFAAIESHSQKSIANF